MTIDPKHYRAFTQSPIRIGNGSRSRGNQRGATLFVSLMILILLTLLALSVAQVTGLQERMAGLYRADQQAFQSAERQMRIIELEGIRNNYAICIPTYTASLPATWTDGTDTSEIRIENLARGVADGAPRTAFAGSAGSAIVYIPGGANCGYFRVSSLQPDQPGDPTTTALVQSIFVY